MDDAQGVGFVEGSQRLAQDVDDTLEGEGTVVSRDTSDVAAAQVFHHQIGLSLRSLAEIEDGDGVRMAQATGRSGLIQKSGGRELFVDQMRMDDFDRDGAPQGDLLGGVHSTHSTDAYEVADPIPSRKSLSDQSVVRLAVRALRELCAAGEAERMRLVAGHGAMGTRAHRTRLG